MNAAGLIIMAMGLILIIIGVKGSQHNIIDSLKGVKATNTTAETASGGSTNNTIFYPTPTGQTGSLVQG